MSDNSGIEWTDATWNPVIGCSKVSPGCDHCYAIRTAHRMQANPNPKVSAPYAGTESGGDWTGRVNLVAERLELPLRWRRPRLIFVNSQSDLFHDQVPDTYIAQVFAVMALAPRHTFQVLTKRHGRMRSLLTAKRLAPPDLNFEGMVRNAAHNLRNNAGRTDWPRADDLTWPLPNVWLGVSTETQQWADIRIPALLDTPAAVRWISAEPLLGPILLCRCDGAQIEVKRHPFLVNSVCPLHGDVRLDWVVTGGESGPGARPMDPQWARHIRNQCIAADVPFLHKQNGEWASTGRYGLGILETRRCYGSATETVRGDITIHEILHRAGKKVAGRELDGQRWDQYPVAVS